MASHETSPVSSPLSSPPEHLTPRASSPYKPTATSNIPNHSKPGTSDDEKSQASKNEDWDEEVSTEIGKLDPETVSETALFTADAMGDGFAQSDIDAAIAASLTKRAPSVPAKRAYESDGEANKGVGKAKQRKRATGAAKAAATRRRVMLTTSSKSPLVNVNLTKLLRLPGAWRSLTYAQQMELASMLPDRPDIGGTGSEDSCNVMLNALMSNDALRTDVREWHESLQNGTEELEWKEEAYEAMECRARGELGSGKWVEVVREQREGSTESGNGVVEAWWRDPSLKA